MKQQLHSCLKKGRELWEKHKPLKEEPLTHKHKYILFIEYALKHCDEGFSAHEAINELTLSEAELSFIKDSIFMNASDMMRPIPPSDINDPIYRKSKWILRPEAYFSYLQYREFRHAVTQARVATFIAIISLFVAIITAQN